MVREIEKRISFPFSSINSGKLKGMMPTIIEIAEKLKSKVSTVAAENKEHVVDIKELAVR